MGFIPGPSDPFYQFMVPSPDETPAQRMVRLKREHDAQRVNDKIEEDIKQQKADLKKEKGVIKVLLLGQSESDFRMRYAQEEWERERNGWRAVVQLNIVKSMTTILRVVEEELNGEGLSNADDDSQNGSAKWTGLNDRHRFLMIRLTSLKAIETELRRRLGAATEEIVPMKGPTPAFPGEEYDFPCLPRMTELAVRSWGDVLLPGQSSMSSSSSASGSDEITHTLANCKEDMKALWTDPAVKQALKKRHIQMSDSSGFFLNDLNRIASREYVVTDDDIVRARLRTIGIQEYRLTLPQGRDGGWQWRIYDVGGCRTLRKAWLPYFNNVNVIIFLSPISVFDQRLEEDPTVNRLEDSIKLWSYICESKLLERTQLILFLNKCDLLGRKLKRGVRVADFLPSYKDKPNAVTPFVKYARHTYIYATTVTDTANTGVTLESVRDGVLRENLAASQLI
ncbi:heterotrimeric G protein alpha subunit [Cyathus striatus]|nr:heterotrimeric G protein alpha subunit [Cyathus striatus]